MCLGSNPLCSRSGPGVANWNGDLSENPLTLDQWGGGPLLGAGAERHPQRLPAPRIRDGVAGVDRLLEPAGGGIGIAVELVGTIGVAVVDDRFGGSIANLDQPRYPGPILAVEGLHLLGEVELAGREQIDQGRVGRS